ncbi:MAG: bifunctional precorrin-2 dehydrogenase/sirohydrochlorin ferrochelatase [Chloroflexota bacterium]
MKTYPINLVLDNRLVILIGGKGEITKKIPGLLEVGAHIRVIAPAIDEAVIPYVLEEQVEWLARPYTSGDLTGAALVIANTGHDEIHDAVWTEGQANGQLVNVMDVLPQCNFHAASLVRQGQLTISIGTGGAAPALAVTLRKRFEREFGPEYGEFLAFAQAMRPEIARRIPPFKTRAKFWYDLVEGQAVNLLRDGKREAFEQHFHTLLDQHEYLYTKQQSASKQIETQTTH